MCKSAWARAVVGSAFIALLGACGGSSKTPADTTPEPEPDGDICIPNRTIYDTVAQKMIADHCNTCHGEQPDFGAPYSLTDYDDLIEGEVGERKIDRMVARMADKTMPPAGTTQVPHFELDTLVGWGSCGLVHPDESIGLNVSAPIYEGPEEPPEDSEILDLLAPQFEVSEDTLDLYQCFTFEAPFEADRFLRRIEIVVDESRVLHHIVLLRDVDQEAPLEPHVCNSMAPNSEYLYAWAPGGGAIQFPDGGLRIEPSDRFVMQIHYNNGAGIEGVRDSSGIRLHHTEPSGTEYGMFSPGPLDFDIPADTQMDIQGSCEVPVPTTVLAGMPHMHEIGDAFRQDVLRADGTLEPLIELTGWSFESQFFYDTPFELEPGDTLVTSCTFDNPGSETVSSGNGTSDEMCFNFMYVTPPPPVRFCDDQQNRGNDLEYDFGACFPEEAAGDLEEEDLELVGNDAQFGAASELTGGELSDGIWVLEDANMWFESVETPLGDLAPNTEIEAVGLAFIEADRVALDFVYLFELEFVSGDEIEEGFVQSVSGIAAPEGSALNLTPDCGGEGISDIQFETDGDSLTVRYTPPPTEGVTFAVELTFERLP